MTAPENTIALIEQRLNEAFSPFHIEITDESHLHAGHAGAQSGRGHYALSIRAETFSGTSPIQRHKMIYHVLGSMMQTHIHALSINAKP